jgi:hypothetical protein
MICNRCHHEIAGSTRCLAAFAIRFPDGLTLPAIPHTNTTDRCGDCGVGAGSVHHNDCDMEECPRCHEQMVGHACDLPAYD